MAGRGSLPSVMKHDFSRIPLDQIQRSSFDRSHGHKTTFDAGYLIPIFVDEALPGDTFNLDLTALARLATPIYPVMDNLFMDTFFFSVPYRLLWDNWERFNGAQDNPGDSTDYLVPQMPAPVGGFQAETLYDYLGLPVGVAGFEVDSLVMRAYNLVWNEWFRDENLQDAVVVDKDDGPDDPADYVLLRRGKRHDYFTSCLPWPQKGPAVELPLGQQAPIASDAGAAVNLSVLSTAQGDTYRGLSVPSNSVQMGSAAGVEANRLYADLSAATAATIASLRQAVAIQQLYELDARGGTRYIETIKAHFGVTSPDARLQRPEYLGGGSTPVVISPVTQTSATDSGTPLAELAAVGQVMVRNNGFTHSFTEHCIVIGLISVRADLNYQQGLNRMWSRQTRWDFYWPKLAGIGEQAVLNKEIMTQGTSADDDVFGYQERFAEYRYKPSLVTGQMRSSFAQSLDAWHLAQDFGSLPVLNEEFIEEDPPVDRVIAVAGVHFKFDSYIRYRCARPMPMYSIPGIVGRF